MQASPLGVTQATHENGIALECEGGTVKKLPAVSKQEFILLLGRYVSIARSSGKRWFDSTLAHTLKNHSIKII
jgi:hypothetical protein